MITRENKYDVQKSAEILKASVTATKIIAVQTRMDVMGGTVESQRFIQTLIDMERHLDQVLEQCERCI